jgi:hypothetical protein
MEDLRHLEVLAAHIREINLMIYDHNVATSGITDRDTLVAMREEFSAELVELLKRQKRAIDYMMSRPVEPQVQFGECVLTGKGAVGAG